LPKIISDTKQFPIIIPSKLESERKRDHKDSIKRHGKQNNFKLKNNNEKPGDQLLRETFLGAYTWAQI
jgi:hypothetical protein